VYIEENKQYLKARINKPIKRIIKTVTIFFILNNFQLLNIFSFFTPFNQLLIDSHRRNIFLHSNMTEYDYGTSGIKN
jgi:hypothetical protein